MLTGVITLLRTNSTGFVTEEEGSTLQELCGIEEEVTCLLVTLFEKALNNDEIPRNFLLLFFWGEFSGVEPATGKNSEDPAGVTGLVLEMRNNPLLSNPLVTASLLLPTGGKDDDFFPELRALFSTFKPGTSVGRA